MPVSTEAAKCLNYLVSFSRALLPDVTSSRAAAQDEAEDTPALLLVSPRKPLDLTRCTPYLLTPLITQNKASKLDPGSTMPTPGALQTQGGRGSLPGTQSTQGARGC